MLNTFAPTPTGFPLSPQTTGSSQPTMSSLEIAELTGKLHQDVLRDIRKLFDDVNEDASKFAGMYLDAYKREKPCYRLPKDLTITLVAGYRADLRLRIVRRWMELETSAKPAVPALPDFTNPAIAARAWAEQFEARVLAEQTKALIGSKREATAMNTASQAVKKAEKLEVELDRSKHYATVKRMSALYPFREFDWRRLKAVSKSLGIAPVDVSDSNYGSVKAYHASVWWDAYAVRVQALPG